MSLSFHVGAQCGTVTGERSRPPVLDMFAAVCSRLPWPGAPTAVEGHPAVHLAGGPAEQHRHAVPQPPLRRAGARLRLQGVHDQRHRAAAIAGVRALRHPWLLGVDAVQGGRAPAGRRRRGLGCGDRFGQHHRQRQRPADRLEHRLHRRPRPRRRSRANPFVLHGERRHGQGGRHRTGRLGSAQGRSWPATRPRARPGPVARARVARDDIGPSTAPLVGERHPDRDGGRPRRHRAGLPAGCRPRCVHRVRRRRPARPHSSGRDRAGRRTSW